MPLCVNFWSLLHAVSSVDKPESSAMRRVVQQVIQEADKLDGITYTPRGQARYALMQVSLQDVVCSSLWPLMHTSWVAAFCADACCEHNYLPVWFCVRLWALLSWSQTVKTWNPCSKSLKKLTCLMKSTRPFACCKVAYVQANCTSVSAFCLDIRHFATCCVPQCSDPCWTYSDLSV